MRLTIRSRLLRTVEQFWCAEAEGEAPAHCEWPPDCDPLGDDHVPHQVGPCHFMPGNYAAAETALRNRISRTPATDASRAALAATCGHLRRDDGYQLDYSFAEKRKILPYESPADMERIAEGLRKAGLEA